MEPRPGADRARQPGWGVLHPRAPHPKPGVSRMCRTLGCGGGARVPLWWGRLRAHRLRALGHQGTSQTLVPFCLTGTVLRVGRDG